MVEKETPPIYDILLTTKGQKIESIDHFKISSINIDDLFPEKYCIEFTGVWDKPLKVGDVLNFNFGFGYYGKAKIVEITGDHIKFKGIGKLEKKGGKIGKKIRS